MNLVTVISTKLDDVSRRLVKFTRLGKNDVQETEESAPFGFDSNPIKDMVAVYSPTEQNGQPVIIGYINKNQLSAVGESRIYSTDAAGELSFFLHLKNDGTAEFGGNSDFLVRYSPLQTEVHRLRDDLNGLISKFNTHIHVVTTPVAGVPTPGAVSPTVSPATPSSIDISGAKIDEIKTL